MAGRTRHQSSLAFTSYNHTGNDTSDGRGYLPVSDETQFFTNVSDCSDELHPGWRNAKGGDSGGNLDLWSTVYSDLVPAKIHRSYPRDWGNQVWNAECLPLYVFNYMGGSSSQVGEEPLQPVTNSAVIAAGTTGMSRSLPTNPSFGLSRAIGELRKDGLPAIIGMQTLKEKSKYLKNSGNEYLNVQFGWLPLISDVLNFARSVKESNKIVKQYQHSADSKVRRRYTFPTQSTTQITTDIDAVVSCNPTGWFWNGAQKITSRHESSFSGAFRYHVPMGDDLPSRMIRWESEANKLLGLRLTPKTLWDLAPWTWAIGWFSNMGDVLNNITKLGADGLVMEYGYVMDSNIVVDEMSAWCTWDPFNYAPTTPYYCSRTLTTKYLRRRGASWYGFGLDVPVLSASQDAVVVALGLSHGLR